VSGIEFTLQSVTANAQSLQALAPGEPVLAVSFETRIGDNNGMMNIAIPAILVKMTRQKFEGQASFRHSPADDDEQAAMARLQPALLSLDVRLVGPTLPFAQLLQLHVNDVLAFDYPIDRPRIVKRDTRLCFNIS
jgi:flagellar motor switch protein FliM